MREVTGDFWTYPSDWKCIPTNGVVTKDGKAVMGAGVALEAKRQFPGLEYVLGGYLLSRGNTVSLLMYREKIMWISFPTKHHWREKADLKLIQESCDQLFALWQDSEWEVTGEKLTVMLPRVGTGKGGLSWEEVGPILREHLPEENFLVIS